jgi:hypothetical protein
MLAISKISYDSSLDGSGYIDFPIGNVGDTILIKIEFYVENSNVLTTDNSAEFYPTNVNSLDTADCVYFENAEFVQGVRVGDTLEIADIGVGYDGTYVVLEKVDANTIRLDDTFANSSVTSGNITNVSDFKGIKYNYNFQEIGSNSYDSLIGEAQTQLLTYNNLDATDVDNPHTMSFGGKKNYQIGSATITGKGVVNGKQLYELIHTTTITPLYLENQLNNFTERTNPTYFSGEDSLQYVYKLSLSRSLLDITNVQTIEDIVPCNFGWFNENFNGLESNYSITSVTYDNDIDTLDLSGNTEVTIVLACNDSSFTTSNNVKFGFFFCPDEQADYQNNNNTFTTNFQYDYKINAADGVLANGTNNGNSKQIIKDLTVTVTDVDTLTIVANIELGASALAYISASENRQFAFFVETENPALANDSSDRVNLLCDFNEFGQVLAEINIVNCDTVFLEHPNETRDYGQTVLDAQIVDDIVANSDIYIDFTGLENDNISIKSVTPSIRLVKSGETDIVLEDYKINCDAFDSIQYGSYYIQDISFAQGREFKIPDTEIRKNIVLARDYDNDNIGSNIFHFALNYPFMIRWEYWKQLFLTNKPSDFFDAAEDFNGYNQQWERLSNFTGWAVEYRVDVEIERLGVLYNQSFSNPLPLFDYDTNAEWNTTIIASGIENGGTKYLKAYENTEITATFEKISGSLPSLANTVIVLWIELYENGGITDIRRLSSLYSSDANSWFVEDKVTVTNPSSGVYVGTATIDASNLPLNSQFTIYGRIYEANVTPDIYLITNDSIIVKTINEQYITVL